MFDVRPPTRTTATRILERPGVERRNTRYIAATDSVRTTAAACDYLDPRLTGDDTVVVIIASESRDGTGALDVAGAVLAAASDEGATNSSSSRMPGTPRPARRSASPPGVSSRVPTFR